jgi:hypothetical protein
VFLVAQLKTVDFRNLRFEVMDLLSNVSESLMIWAEAEVLDGKSLEDFGHRRFRAHLSAMALAVGSEMLLQAGTPLNPIELAARRFQHPIVQVWLRAVDDRCQELTPRSPIEQLPDFEPLASYVMLDQSSMDEPLGPPKNGEWHRVMMDDSKVTRVSGGQAWATVPTWRSLVHAEFHWATNLDKVAGNEFKLSQDIDVRLVCRFGLHRSPSEPPSPGCSRRVM